VNPVLPDFDLNLLDEQARDEELTPNRAWRRNFINSSRRHRQDRRFARSLMARMQPPTMHVPRGV
jgi:hypothetical protein